MKRIAIAIAIMLALAGLVASCVIRNMTQVDRSTLEYRDRIEKIWPGTPPGRIAGAERGDIDSAFLRFLFASELEREVPYIVAYPLEDTAPAVLVLPGGGYSFRAEKMEGTEIAEWLNSIGVAAFVLNYRVSPYRHPTPLLDAKRAMRWIRANASRLRVDPTRVGVLGSSAGGHLAAVLATDDDTSGVPAHADPVERESSRPDVLILSQPVISMVEHAHEGSKRKLLGDDPDPALLEELSADRRVTSATPPAFVWTTRTDDMVDPRHAELFASALERHGVEHELHMFARGRHGLGLARGHDEAGEWPSLCAAWLARVGLTD